MSAYDDGRVYVLVPLAMLTAAGLWAVGKAEGSFASRKIRRQRCPRVFLAGGNEKMTPNTVRHIEDLGIQVTGGEGERRYGKAARAGEVDAIVVMRNAVSPSTMPRWRAMAEQAGVPLVVASTRVTDIEDGLRRTGLLE